MPTHTSTADDTALAASVAPEDLRRGDYVAVLNEIFELPSWLWCDSMTPDEEPVRIKYCATDAGMPLKIKAICLPFVFTKSADRQLQTFDVRQVQLVRLDRRYAKTVWKTLRRMRTTSTKHAC
jgi:hypothetical protein